MSSANNSLHVEIDSPCPANLPHLTAEERVRFCTLCSKDVHNLSAMTRAEATTLLDSDEDLCVSYELDDAGGVSFAAAQKSRMGRWVSMAATVALSLTSQTGCADGAQRPGVVNGQGLLDRISAQASGLFRQKTAQPIPMVMGGISRNIKRDKVSAALGTEDGATVPTADVDTPDLPTKPPRPAVRGRRAPISSR